MKFDPNDMDLITAFSESIEIAVEKTDVDVKCLDWFSYSPDFYIWKKDIKAA